MDDHNSDRTDGLLRQCFKTLPEQLTIFSSDLNVLWSNAPGDNKTPCDPGLIQEANSLGKPVSLERHSATDERMLAVCAFPIHDDTGEVMAIGELVHDVTALRDADTILRRQHDLGMALAATTELKPALEHILRAAIDISAMDSGGIYLVDPGTGDLELVCSMGLSQAFVASTQTHAADSQHARIVGTGRPLFVDYGEIPVQMDPTRSREGLRGIAIIPIRHGDQVIACINLGSHTRDTIPTELRDPLESTVMQIGSAVARLRAERELGERVEDLHTVFESMGDFLFILDHEGRIVRVNPAVIERLGYTLEELQGKHVLHVHPPDRREEAQEIIGQILEGKREDCPIPLWTKDGSLIPVETRITVGTWAGHPAIIGVSRDMTARNQAEEQQAKMQAKMQQTQKLESLGVLAGGIAHDFNNLLTGILGSADLALLDASKEHAVRHHMTNIQETSHQAADLCRQMLAYSGQGHFIVEPIVLSMLIHDMAQLLKVSVSKNVVLHLELGERIPLIEANASQLRQIVLNLVINASEALEDQSGTIRVTTGARDFDAQALESAYLDDPLEEGNYVYVEVEDTGSGMDESTLNSLFDPFFTTKFTGRGLGLAATLGIVRSHKGTIQVASTVGVGSTFTVLIPAAREQEEDTTTDLESSLSLWRWSGTILLVDDVDTVRTVARRMLKRMGFEVIQASDGVEGVRMYREHADQITLVLLDMTMPHMGGAEAFAEIRKIRSDARVILMSGYSERKATSSFAEHELDGFVPKPLSFQGLKTVIRQVLDPLF